MNENERLAQRFDEHRARLRAVAYRMLGSADEADDAVQETWLRLSRTDSGNVESLPAWLTTVVARVSLNMLRSRKSRREEPLERHGADQIASEQRGDPEQEALLADSVGLALIVVLDTLSPAERLAFVLHDMFDVPFDDLAPIVGRSVPATRQLASRARCRVKGVDTMPDADHARQRHVVDAYLAATRAGDFEALVALLDPDVVLRADREVVPTPSPIVIHGARAVAKGAMASMGRAQSTQPVLVNGMVGLVMAAGGRSAIVLRFGFNQDKITEIDVIADQDRLSNLELSVLNN